MFKFVVLVSLVACALGSPLSQSRPHLDGRIVGGKEISISEVPYQLSLMLDGEHLCGATLLTPQVALTSGHCVVGEPVSSLSVRAGSSSRISGGVVVNVVNYVFHPKIDVAVIKLETPLSLGSTINAIQLVEETPADGTKAMVSGWGTNRSEGTSLPVQLRAASVRIISKEKCSSLPYGYGKQIKSENICAAAFRKDACEGDSGGPLTVDGGLAGIVAWGVGCGYIEYPGVYIDVNVIRKWILESVRRFED
ncbi:trypsin beta-like [Eupeodes corollae]|uniref:trypsin beta-like n=1 Tax=Eupeodes corollae TaxID=290404 RepID=UPI00248F872C|nr:trypsin beta-like [Eupeodes corollae]